MVLTVAAILVLPRRPLTELASAWPGWLAGVLDVPVVAAATRLAPASLAALRRRDVVVMASAAKSGQAELRVGRDGVRVPAARWACEALPCWRPTCEDLAMDETLGDDATVDVVVAGRRRADVAVRPP